MSLPIIINITLIKRKKGKTTKVAGNMYSRGLVYIHFVWKRRKRSTNWKLMINGKRIETPDHFNESHWEDRSIMKWMVQNLSNLKEADDVRESD